MNEQKKSIWILNHHASTDGHRHYELTRRFARLGYDVTVIASSFSNGMHIYIHEEEVVIKDICDGARMVCLHTRPIYKKNDAKRILNMFSYLRMVKTYAPSLWEKYGKPTYVIGSCVHPLAWEAAYWVAEECKAEFICEVRDLWPLSLVEISGMSKYHPLVLFFSVIERRAYRRADKIVTTFPYGYKYICDEKGYPREKVFWVPNGIHLNEATDDISIPDELNTFLTSHWCCVYAGSLVKSECVDFMLDAFELLKDADIWFAIIGDGTERKDIESRITQQKMQRVKLFPRMDKRKVVPALKKAKVCLAAHHSLSIYRYGLSMNKLNDYLLSGRPVVFACGMPNVIEETKNISIPYGNAEDMANAIRSIKALPDDEYWEMAADGQRVIREQYDYELLAKKYLDIIEQ